MLLRRASRPRRPREPLRLLVPVSWLAVALVFLVGFRVGLNVTDSNVIDVGYAGVIGADRLDARPAALRRLADGQRPRRHLRAGATTTPTCRSSGSFGWSGRWDDLPAAHAAAIVFDLLTLLGAVPARPPHPRADARGRARLRVGRATRSRSSCSNTNSNDALVALLLVVALLVAASPPARGVLGRARGADEVRAARARAAVRAHARDAAPRRARQRSGLRAFVATRSRSASRRPSRCCRCCSTAATCATFWDRTIAFQARPRRAVLGLGPLRRARTPSRTRVQARGGAARAGRRRSCRAAPTLVQVAALARRRADRAPARRRRTGSTSTSCGSSRS